MKEDEVVTLEGQDAFLDAFCMQYNTSIVDIDRKLDELHDDNPNKAELVRYRKLIASANSHGDLKLLDAWLHALMIGLKAATHTIPLALSGKKFKSGRKPGATGKLRNIVEDAYNTVTDKSCKSVIKAMEGANGVDEVEWSDETVWIKGEDASRTFKTIQNIVTELRSKKNS